MSTFTKNIYQSYENQEACDFTLYSSIDSYGIKCHAIVVSSSKRISQELTKNNEKSLTVPGADETLLKIVVEYMYTGELKISEENIEKILKIAEFLQLDCFNQYNELHHMYYQLLLKNIFIKDVMIGYCGAPFFKLQETMTDSGFGDDVQNNNVSFPTCLCSYMNNIVISNNA